MAAWQVAERGGTSDELRHASRELRQIFEDVWVSGHAPLTDWQRWKGATLSTRRTRLALASAGALMGLRSDAGSPTLVVRQGDGGPRHYPPGGARECGLTVHRRRDMSESSVIDDIDSISPARTVLDLVAVTSPMVADRVVRDALRTKVVRPADLRDQVRAHAGSRGVDRLRRLVTRYGDLRLDRTRSDAEVLAWALLIEAGIRLSGVNVRLAGHEADFQLSGRNVILEVDGPQFHQFAAREAMKQAAWEMAGWVVRRTPSGVIYDQPGLFLATARRPISADELEAIRATRGPADVRRRWRLE